jgi:hypothetical protein
MTSPVMASDASRPPCAGVTRGFGALPGFPVGFSEYVEMRRSREADYR